MKAAIYCRVSTDNQEREGTSLQTQLENCVCYCQTKDYDVSYSFNEAYSGLSLERPEMDKLRELVRTDAIDVIVCYSLDRLTRGPGHGVIITQELEKHHVILEAVTEDVDNTELGKLISYIRGYASKVEAQLKVSQNAVINVPQLEGFIRDMLDKLPLLDLEGKRLALDMLGITVYLNEQDIEITGIIEPKPKLDIVNQTSRRLEHNTSIPFKILVNTPT